MSTQSENSQQAFMLKPKCETNSINNENLKYEDNGIDTELGPFVSMKKGKPRKTSNSRCFIITVSGILFMIFLGAVVILVLLFLLVGERPPRVKLPCVDLVGDFDSATKTFIFKGIRYANAPVGELRFKPPVQCYSNETCSSEVYYALSDPPQCVQRDVNTGHVIGSEDCLYLNIFTPAVDPLQLAPVMVYIHGGYLQFGNATTPGYCPNEQNAANLGVVFVNVQYRLNAFGFLVTEVDSGTGNYGFHDQIMALQWVQKHIKKFGGDPKQVTIFGQSSGGTSVFALLTSPKAKGLFQKAWMLSGSPILNMTLEQARVQNRFFLEKINCSTLSCLQALKVEQVVNALYPEWDVLQNSVDLPLKGVFEPSLPVIDDVIFYVPPFEAWERKLTEYYSDVPVVIGTTAQEIDCAPAPGIEIKDWNKDDLNEYVSRYLDRFDPSYSNITLSNLYKSEEDAEYIFTTITSDIRVNCGNNLLATKAAKALHSPVYRYVVTAVPSHEAHPLNFKFPAKYAFHSWDIYGFLGTYTMIMSETRSSDQQFSNLIKTNMLNFVQSGHPASKTWTPYPSSVALLGSQLTINKSDYNKEQCDFWLNNGFFAYSWIN